MWLCLSFSHLAFNAPHPPACHIAVRPRQYPHTPLPVLRICLPTPDPQEQARWMDDTPAHSTPNGHNSTPDAAQPQDLVPPYWQSRKRATSVASHASSEVDRPDPIRLEDHTVENSDQSRALWARSVSIDEYVIVSGNVPGMGDYVVWNCTVQTLNVRLVGGWCRCPSTVADVAPGRSYEDKETVRRIPSRLGSWHSLNRHT